MAWKTVKDNHIELQLPTGGVESLRVVWKEGGSDVCYVVSCDGNNGNSNARLIAAAPDLWNACRLMWDAVAECGCQVPPQVLEAARYCKRVAVKSF
jgi:hypothetical protein